MIRAPPSVNFTKYSLWNLNLPIELNLVKKVADLKFSNGATSKTKNIGTVLSRSQTFWNKVLSTTSLVAFATEFMGHSTAKKLWLFQISKISIYNWWQFLWLLINIYFYDMTNISSSDLQIVSVLMTYNQCLLTTAFKSDKPDAFSSGRSIPRLS